ncbi:MAG: hypothetical protein CMC79_00535 [Flavobacteriaceae bacterium]|nr:hypothetical protein [Flavobacteriaceae bacterium]
MYNKVLKQKIESIGNTANYKVYQEIAEHAYYYKDWKTVIEYSQKSISIFPNERGFFLLGSASGFASLMENKINSIFYLNKMKYGFKNSYNFNAENIVYLKALLLFYSKVPKILGGNMNLAFKYANELKMISEIEGFLAFAHLAEVNNNFKEAKEQYLNATNSFDIINQDCNNLSLVDINRRNLLYELSYGQIKFGFVSNNTICMLQFLESSYSLSDSFPKKWLYLRLAKAFYFLGELDNYESYINKAMLIDPEFIEVKSFLNNLGE